MLRCLTAGDLAGGIQLLDVGASGRPDPKWRPLAHLINLVAFEPNSAECARLTEQQHGFRSTTFLPYALGGHDEQATLYKTKSIYCYSLLEPNADWLGRFAFRDLFEVTGKEPIRTHRLEDLPELAGLDVDAIKLDTQGLEVPILDGAGDLLEQAFYVETETGFVENYSSETTYAQIDEFMRDHGFLLFDLNARHRIPRGNPLGVYPTGKEQILWCEAVWLKDYVKQANADWQRCFSREKALKVLLLCAIQGCADFGFELARLFQQQGFVSASELELLGDRQNWRVSTPQLSRVAMSCVGAMTRVLPRRLRRVLAEEVEKNLEQPSALRSIFSSRKRAA